MDKSKEDHYKQEIFSLKRRIHLLREAIQEAREGRVLGDWSVELSREIILADSLVTDDLILKQSLIDMSLH